MMAEIGGLKLHLGTPAVSPKPTWAKSFKVIAPKAQKIDEKTPKQLSFQVVKYFLVISEQNRQKPTSTSQRAGCCHDVMSSETPKQLQQDLQDTTPFRLSQTSSCHLRHLCHLSMSLTTSLPYKTCAKLVISRLRIRIWMHSTHSDAAMWYDTFLFSDFTSWKIFSIQVSVREMESKLTKAQAFAFRSVMQNPLNLSSSMSRILIEWMNHDESWIYNLHLSLSSRKTGAKWVTWPGCSDPLDELDQFIFSLEWRWVKYVQWKSWKQRSVWNQKASLGNQAHCSEESKAIWHLTVTVPPGKYGVLENRIMTSGCTENANKNLPRKWWHSPNLRLLDSNIGRWFEPSERLGHWENSQSKALQSKWKLHL